VTENSDRSFRLRDPDDTKPLPPPGQANILPTAVFAQFLGPILLMLGTSPGMAVG